MQLLVFVGIVLVSGAMAGTVQGLANLALVEPVLDRAISIENRALFDSGQVQNDEKFRIEHEQYRMWQKWGQVLASVILGISFGSFFGLVYAYSKNALPGSNAVKKSLVLAGIMWLILFAIPFMKYPSNPPTVGDSETVTERTLTYVGLIASSGLLALGLYYVSKMLHGPSRLAVFAAYACIIAVLLAVFPSNPEAQGAVQDLLYDFRFASAISITAFWVTLPVVMGLLWGRFLSADEK